MSYVAFRSISFSGAKGRYFSVIVAISEIMGLSHFGSPKSTRKFIQYLVFVGFIIAYALAMPTYIEWIKHPQSDSLLMSLEIKIRFMSSITIIVVQKVKNKQVNRAFLKCFMYDSGTDNLFSLHSTYPVKNMIFSFSSLLIYCVIYHITYKVPILINFFHSVICLLYIEFPTLQFIYLTTVLRIHERAINEKLRKLTQADEKRSEESIADDIFMYRRKHQELVELGNIVTHTYSYQILICVSEFFFEMIFFLQASFRDLIIHPTSDVTVTAGVFVVNGSFVLLLLAKIVRIARCCENNLEESTRTNMIINSVINSNQSGRILEELRAFLLQVSNGTVSFSILGITTMDYKLVYTVMSSVFSYGIIIGIYVLSQVKGGKGKES